jgi:hypothetical protein
MGKKSEVDAIRSTLICRETAPSRTDQRCRDSTQTPQYRVVASTTVRTAASAATIVTPRCPASKKSTYSLLHIARIEPKPSGGRDLATSKSAGATLSAGSPSTSVEEDDVEH